MEKTIHSKTYQILRQWLVTTRHEKKITQRELAHRLDVPYSWVAKVELGERRLDVIELVRMCKALNVDPEIGFKLICQYVESE